MKLYHSHYTPLWGGTPWKYWRLPWLFWCWKGGYWPETFGFRLCGHHFTVMLGRFG